MPPTFPTLMAATSSIGSAAVRAVRHRMQQPPSACGTSAKNSARVSKPELGNTTNHCGGMPTASSVAWPATGSHGRRRHELQHQSYKARNEGEKGRGRGAGCFPRPSSLRMREPEHGTSRELNAAAEAADLE